jgi:hypothetical protein
MSQQLKQLTEEQLEQVRAKMLNPATGSKLAAAKEFGVDLSLLLENLRLSPQERVERMLGAMRLLAKLRGNS